MMSWEQRWKSHLTSQTFQSMFTSRHTATGTSCLILCFLWIKQTFLPAYLNKMIHTWNEVYMKSKIEHSKGTGNTFWNQNCHTIESIMFLPSIHGRLQSLHLSLNNTTTLRISGLDKTSECLTKKINARNVVILAKSRDWDSHLQGQLYGMWNEFISAKPNVCTT